ncbi:2-hydroxyhepta-2,4-diene-1,7-dioate isomerase [Ichthyobacterium seriolicida]|uniref:2-hydroxyhepta-2,4-diene-1,7-dioate isomerase n=1 Tax=Ichthyobacterium seriolicida TaxID=242600 RepID=A0A1J1E3D8_9FLAO|nr:2-hydroxyhepta-2,4-diene-1,7-dioate isomerase [Ichthyobacterium seriolicida]
MEADDHLCEGPIFFLKPDSSILLKGRPFFIPEFSDSIFHNVGLLVKINRIGKYISKEFAHKYYDEIGLGVDFTATDVLDKLRRDYLPWEKSKCFDGSMVIGKFIDKKNLINDFSLLKNGLEVQRGNINDMIFSINDIISHVSKFMTMKIGDIIFTGTPFGSSIVKPNDLLVGRLEGEQMFEIKIK